MFQYFTNFLILQIENKIDYKISLIYIYIYIYMRYIYLEPRSLWFIAITRIKPERNKATSAIGNKERVKTRREDPEHRAGRGVKGGPNWAPLGWLLAENARSSGRFSCLFWVALWIMGKWLWPTGDFSAMCFNRGKTPTDRRDSTACRRSFSSSPSLSLSSLSHFLSLATPADSVYRATLNFGSFAYQIRRRINTRRFSYGERVSRPPANYGRGTPSFGTLLFSSPLYLYRLTRPRYLIVVRLSHNRIPATTTGRPRCRARK